MDTLSWWQALLLLPMALLLDALFSEPPARVHPVCGMGALAGWAERRMRSLFGCRDDGAPEQGQGAQTAVRRQRLAGIAAGLLVLVPWTLGAWGLACLCCALNGVAGWLCAAVCIWLCLAPKSLARHAFAVARPLQDGNLAEARRAVSMIVGRCPDALDAHAVGRACVESVAENMTDGVLATLFWAFAGGCVWGLAGAAALPVLHRAANTLDAMWGRKDRRYRYFGTFGARMDDVMDWIPARLSLPLTALGAVFTKGADAHAALAGGWKWRHAHESPNSAWTEAAFACALHLRLGGPALYPRGMVEHPFLGDGSPAVGAAEIRLAVRLMVTTVCVAGILFSCLWLLLVCAAQ